ncbi:MAG: hypothetical protein SFW35_05480 [Chitinophagales bacterium]|nr:hypothetical protein [Chitinophagales bacterium]
MKNAANSQIFDEIIAKLQKGAEPTELIPQLSQLREQAKAKEDALLVKVLRLAMEHIENNGSFEVGDRFEEGLPDDISNLQYFIELVADADNKYNREEIQEFKQVLMNG